MNSGSLTAFLAATLSCALAATVLMRRRSLPAWFFAAGMVVLAGENVVSGLSLAEGQEGEPVLWHRNVLFAKSLIPFLWLAFSLTYVRGDYLRHLSRWKYVLAAALLVPAGLALFIGNGLVPVELSGGGWRIEYGPVAKLLNGVLLVTDIIILTNLEKTLRAAVGTSRWKIKFTMLGLGLVFGARIYARSETLLFSGFRIQSAIIESVALLMGCFLLGVAFLRRGFSDIDIYPSKAVIQSSVTLLLVGGYLFVVGVLAQVASWMGGASSFQFQTMVVLSGVAVLAILFLSDRLRANLRAFVARHFHRPQHDARALWTIFTHRLSSRTDRSAYSAESVKLLAETFQILSVTLWQFDERKDCFSMGASTVEDMVKNHEPLPCESDFRVVLDGLRAADAPFNLDDSHFSWAASLKAASQPRFKRGGVRLCLPLKAGGNVLGAAILMDRVNGVPYSIEELDLLGCIGDQVAAGLLQFHLSEELLQTRELEAFQTMSTFFVHDLKNAASSLSLMLKNFPVHYDNPEFRKDALRGIGSTVDRINQIIQRLSTFRQNTGLKRVGTSLNRLVTDALASVPLPDGVELLKDLQPVPELLADPEQLESVVTNLLMNAVEAMTQNGGRITVQTARLEDRAALSVRDTGCGMSPAFVRESLFRPFRSTKKKGLGIGMFQCRMIVDAHNGSMQVESEPGKGTTFRILLPLAPEPA